MRECKKIIFIILAFLPVMLLIYNACVGIFADPSASFIPMGLVDVADGVLTIEPDSWADYLLTPLGLENTGLGGLMPTMLNVLEWFKLNAGMPINLPVVMALFYFVYLSMLWLFDLLFDLFMFIPKKVQEVIR